MKIYALKSVGGIPFGADRSLVLSLGHPLRESRSTLGEDQLEFPDAVYRFVDGKFVEVSFRLPEVLELDEHRVSGASLVDFLKSHDTDFRERYGFAIAPNFGVAVDLDHDDCWVSAFVAGRWSNIK
jgi:hypothetical protein